MEASRGVAATPSASTSVKRTVRVVVEGLLVLVFWYVMFEARAPTAAAVALALSVITRVAPPVPPVQVPITTPP